jgi:hypothetical protein
MGEGRVVKRNDLKWAEHARRHGVSAAARLVRRRGAVVGRGNTGSNSWRGTYNFFFFSSSA